MLDKINLDDRRSRDDHSSLVVQTPNTLDHNPFAPPATGVERTSSDADQVPSVSRKSRVGAAPNTDRHSNYEGDCHVMHVDQSLLAADDHTASAVSTLSADHISYGTHCNAVGGTSSEIDQTTCAKQPTAVDLAPIVVEIIAEHMRRQAAMKAQKRLDQSAGSMARRLCGWRVDLPEKERGQLNKRAERIIGLIEKHNDIPAEDALIVEQLLPFVMATMAGREPFDQLRKNAEKVMVGRAKSLPVWPWVDAIKGVDAGGLAAIVGEAGDLSNYPTVAKLWKRLGLAVMDGKRQGSPGKSAKAEDWIAHGYSGRRRSVVWNVGHALVMCNGDGEYRQVYLARKEYEKARDPEMSKGHAANRAQRYMEKRFVRNLWKAWRAALAGSPE